MTEPNETSTEPNSADGVTFHERVASSPRRSIAMRAGVLAGSAALVVVGIVAAMGASPSPTATGADPSASTPTAKPDASGAPDRNGPWRVGRHAIGDFGPFGFGRGSGPVGFGDITVTKISGSNVSLETVDGWSRTIAVTADTKITKGGKTIAAGDLTVGDQVRLRQSKADDGTFDVTGIVVVLPTVAGQVSAIDGNTITVTVRGGTTQKIHVDADTTYAVNGTSGKLSDLEVGSIIVAEGTQRTDGSLDAAAIQGGKFDRDHLPGLRGGPKSPDASPAPSGNAG
jgi:Domain of unknown function (DUF5666)